MSRFKPERAMELALAASCAYPDGREKLDELALHNVEFFNVGSAEGFVGSTGKKVILAFRGSTFTQGNRDVLLWLDSLFADWSVNLTHRMQQFHSGRVQSNYLSEFEAVWPTLAILLETHGVRDKQLWITGHSLGGALATLAGAKCKWTSNLDPIVYTFGAPRVGDANFGEHYPVNLVRFENRYDLIPLLPPSGKLIQALRMLSSDVEAALERWFGPDFVSSGYAHLGELQYIDRKGRIVSEVNLDERLLGFAKTILFDPSLLIQDHWIESYCAAIDSTL
jgi:hypothetical protein